MSNSAPANTPVTVTTPPPSAPDTKDNSIMPDDIVTSVFDQLNMEELLKEKRCENNGKYFYFVFHVILALLAIYLSYRCNSEFRLGSFLFALFFPYIYIIYILATEGTCGILDDKRRYMNAALNK